jgi:hypothetical protein
MMMLRRGLSVVRVLCESGRRNKSRENRDYEDGRLDRARAHRFS